MGIDKSPQFKSKNGCIYVFRKTDKKWYKICPADGLPTDVLAQIREIREKAEYLKYSE